MIQYKCPKCGATLESPSSMASQQDKCPLCGQVCVVPQAKNRLPLILGASGAGAAVVVLAVAVAWLWPSADEPKESSQAGDAAGEKVLAKAPPEKKLVADEPKESPEARKTGGEKVLAKAPPGTELPTPPSRDNRARPKPPPATKPKAPPATKPKAPPATKPKAPPALSVKGSWRFSTGSGGFAPSPNEWVTTLTFENPGPKTWTVVPDMILVEAVETQSIAGGICPGGLHGARNKCVPFILRSAPKDKSGSGSTLLIYPTGGGGATVSFSSFEAHWKLDGKEHLWQATDLKRGGKLECEWEYPNVTTFKAEVKGKGSYNVSHVGPLFYDKADTTGPAYVLASRLTRAAGKKGKWQCANPVFLPLTPESVRKEIDDKSKPVARRSAFLAWLWHQPRPCKDADQVLMAVLEAPGKYPTALRGSAASALLVRRHRPALKALRSLAANKEADADLRTRIIGDLDQILPAGEVQALARIARDPSDTKKVRESALRTLSRMGPEGWVVVKELANDKELSETAESLLNARKKKSK